MHPGIHHLSNDDYHTAPALQNSGIKELLRSPAHYQAWLTRSSDDATPAMEFGSAFHAAVLEPEIYATEYAVKPEGMKFSTRDGKEWRDDHASMKIISHADDADISGMRQAIIDHPVASALIKKATAKEESIFWEIDGILCKCRLDIRLDSPAWIADLKKTVDASPAAFSRACYNYGYDVQAAWYLRGAKAHFRDAAPEGFFFLAIEPVAPYALAIYRASDAMVAAGDEKIDRAIVLYKECTASGRWPGYDDNINEIDLPKWAA